MWGVPRLGLHCGHLRLGLARSLLRLLGIGLGLLREALRIGSGLCHNTRNTNLLEVDPDTIRG